MKHLSPEDLSTLLDGAATPARRAEMESHLAGCAACRDALAALSAQDLELKDSLSFDPGDSYFDTFAARVRARIESGPARSGAAMEAPMGGPSDEPSQGRRGVFGWLLAPGGLRWAGAAAALIVAVGVVFTLGREGRFGPGRSSLEDRAMQTAPAEPQAAMESQPAPSGEESRAKGAAPVPAPVSAVAPTSEVGGANDRLAVSAPAPATATGAPRSNEAPSRMKEARRSPEGDEVPAPAAGRPLAVAPAPSSAPESEKSRAVKQPASPLAAESPSRAPAPPTLQEESRALARDEGATRQRADATAKGGAMGKLEARELKTAAAQLCGTVVDAKGRPVPRATVVVVGAKATAITGADGRFCLPSEAGTATLAVYALGYQPERQTVQLASGTQETMVALDPVSVLETPKIGSAYRSDPGIGMRGLLDTHPVADAFAAWPAGARELARETDRHATEAMRRRSATGLEDAAVDWGRVAGLLEGRDEQIQARERMADAAYRAWEIEPTRARAEAAGAALDAYVEHAPKGLTRDLAIERRAKIRSAR